MGEGSKSEEILGKNGFVAHAARVRNDCCAFAVVRIVIARDVRRLDDLPAVRAHKARRVVISEFHQKTKKQKNKKNKKKTKNNKKTKNLYISKKI
jgi:hypothetical protein